MKYHITMENSSKLFSCEWKNYFGQFEFYFESYNDYTKDIFEAVAMHIYILNESAVKVSRYDI